jgi:serine/threonine protein kinase/outer membrane protein assembly factor BamB
MAVIFARGDKLESGHYTVLKELGVGGMGVVYQCRDEQLMRDVAIKMLLPELMADKSSVEIFHQEARFAAKLEHPNIVTVYDIGVEERQKKQHHFVSMEYLPGGNLANRVIAGPLAVEHCLNWMKQLASGLTYAHKNSVIHQDVKADNIFITNEGDLKVGDFGLARLLVGRVHCNVSTKGMGTPAYMSPELCRGEPQDHRSDIYSLGILFFEMATGQLPFRAKGMIEMATKHSSAPIPSARRINPLIPDVLDRVIRRMMAKTPEERYMSMGEVLTILDDLIFELRVARLGLGNRPLLRSGAITAEAQAAAIAAAQNRTSFERIQVPPGALGPKHAEALGTTVDVERLNNKTQPITVRVQPPDQNIAARLGPAVSTKSGGMLESEKLIAQLEQQTATNAAKTRAQSVVDKQVSPPTASPTRPVADIKAKSAASQSYPGRQSEPGLISGSRHAPALSLTPKPSLDLEWCFKTNGPIGWASAPVADKEEKTVYVASSDGCLYAIEIATGQVCWQFQTGGMLLSSPVLVGDQVIVANSAGQVHSIRTGSGNSIWHYDGKEPIISTPVLGRDRLFVATDGGRLFALDTLTGTVHWNYRAGDAIVCSPHKHADLILFGTKAGSFHAVSAHDGKVVWRFAAGSPVIASPAASLDSVYFGTQDGNFYALEADTGGLIWEYPTDRSIVSRAVISFTNVIFCSYDKWLYCCEKYDGRLQWKASVRGKVIANLLVNKDTLLAATHEGWLQGFHTRSGTLLWQKDLDRCLESPPVVCGDHLFQATVEGEVFSYSFASSDNLVEKSA